jgi:hypothetical protein
MSRKLHNYKEFEIEFKGTVTVPFSIKVNQTGTSIEQAIRIARKCIKARPLDLLSPKITSGTATVKTVQALTVNPLKTS